MNNVAVLLVSNKATTNSQQLSETIKSLEENLASDLQHIIGDCNGKEE